MSASRKRKKRSLISRLKPFTFLLFLLAVAAGAAGYFLATWQGFNPKTIAVAGNRIVPSREIVARAAIAPNKNMWLQNMQNAARRIEAIPYIDGAWIHRRPTGAVQIVVTERTPQAIVASPDGSVLVDRSLRVLQTAPRGTTLPVLQTKDALPAVGAFIRAPDVRRLYDDNAQLLAQHVITTRLTFDRFGDLVATMNGGVKLLLGDDSDLSEKSELVAPILSQVGAQGKRIAAIDLRAPKTPVVQYR